MKIGLDIGGSHIAIGAVENGKIISKCEKEIQISKSENPEETLFENMVMLIKQIINELHIENLELIGVAVPGSIKDGTIIRAENLRISNMNIMERLKNVFNVKIVLRNDAKCAGMAEKNYGSIKDFDDAIFLTLGTGIGGAVFMGGKMLVPKKICGFEIGHMVIDLNGKKCTCGRKGCFETLCSMKRMKNDVIEKLNLDKNITGKEVRVLLENPNIYEKVEDIIDRYIYNLATGLSNLINIFEPEIISIGGSFSYYQRFLMDKLTEQMKKKDQIFNMNLIPQIVTATFKNEAGIIGATIE